MKPGPALYTTFFPAVAPYLRPWWDSVKRQTRRDATLWVGLDGMTPREAGALCGEPLPARWLPAPPGATPASLRAHALARILAEGHPAILLADADDILHPERVEAAMADLESCDFTACATWLIDETGRPLDLRFPAGPAPADLSGELPRCNRFGFSTSGLRRDLLAALPPIPARCTAADWWLATCAWLAGAAIRFDPTPRMGYRQHGANLAGVLPPFSPERILRSAGIVIEHHALLAALPPGMSPPDKRPPLEAAAREASAFLDAMRADPAALARYAASLDAAPGPLLWWEWVAHPAMASLWRKG